MEDNILEELGGNSLPYIPKYELIETEEGALKALKILKSFSVLALDTETTGLDPFDSKLLLYQIATTDMCYILNCTKVDPSVWNPILEDEGITKLAQFAQFDYKMLKVKTGSSMRPMFCTMIAERLITVGKQRKTSLKYIANKYLGIDLNKEIRSNFVNKYKTRFSKEELVYAANDALILHEIYNHQIDALQRDGLVGVALLEFKTIVPIAEMELAGCLIDQDRWRSLLPEVIKKRDRIEDEIQAILLPACDQRTVFGKSTINLNSPKQLLYYLNRIGVKLDATDVDTLKQSNTLVTKKLLQWRSWNTVMTKYGEKFLEKIRKDTGRIHANFNQVRADTGRSSSSEPNLQQVLGFDPDDPESLNFRACFIASPGNKIVGADYGQQELRILAEISNDKNLLKAFINGEDVHEKMACLIFNKTPETITKTERLRSKCVSGDTLVDCEDTGSVRIKDLSDFRVSGEFAPLKDVMVKVGSNKNGDSVYKEATEFYYNGIGTSYHIETDYGYCLEAGENHRLLKLFCGKVDLCKASELSIGDWVVFDVSSPKLSGNKKIGAEYLSLSDKTYRTSFKDIELPKKITKTFARWLGYYVSEGSTVRGKTSSSVRIGISNKKYNSEMVKDLIKVTESVWGDRANITYSRDNTVIQSAVNSIKLSDWLLEIGAGHKSYNKNIPEFMFSAPKSLQEEFLMALFEGDGTCSTRYDINLCSKNKALVKSIQRMLLSLGIFTNLSEKVHGSYGAFHYVTIIGYDSREKFMRTVGFLSKRKNDVYFKSKSSFILDKRVIPNQEPLLEALMPKVPSPHKEKVRQSIRDNNPVMFNRVKAEIVVDRYTGEEEDVKFFNEIINNNYRFVQIKNIVEDECELFDLSVPEGKLYVADGFVTHNTTNFTITFGGSAFTVAKRLDIPEEEGEKIVDGYFKSFPGVKDYIANSGNFAIQNKYSLSISGRRRYYDVPHSTDPEFGQKIKKIKRQAANAGIQGSAADVSKQGMCNFFYALEEKGYDAKLIMFVHDELLVDCKEEQAKEVAELLEESMIKGFSDFFKRIPMVADTSISNCWDH